MSDNTARQGEIQDFDPNSDTSAPVIDVQSKADSDRERRVIVQELTLQGKTAEEIAAQLDVSTSTVHRDRRKIRKLNAAIVGSMTHEELVGESLVVFEMLRNNLMKKINSGDDENVRKTVETLIKVQKQIFDIQLRTGLIREAEKDEILSVDGIDISSASKDQLAALVASLNAKVDEARKSSEVTPVPDAG